MPTSRLRQGFPWLAVLLAACGTQPTVRLPKIGTVGTLPPVADTVKLTVHSNGRLVHEGKRLDLNALAMLLHAEVSRRPMAQLNNSREASTLNLLLEVDRDLPVGALLPLWLLLARPGISVHRVFFAVHAEGGGEDGEAGAIAWFLSYDVGGHAPRTLKRGEVVAICRETRSSAPADLYHKLRATFPTPGPRKDAALIIDAAADAPFGFVLRVADAAFRAGLHSVFPVGNDSAWRYARMAGGPNGLDAVVAAIPAHAGELGIQLGDRLLPRTGEPMPPVARTRGGYAGLPQSLRSVAVEMAKTK